MPWNEDIVFNIGAKSGYCYQTEGGATKPLSFEVESRFQKAKSLLNY